MTADKFIQSFDTHKTGDKGFCRLASMSTSNANYELGFWFEIIKNNGKAILFTVQLNSSTKESPDKKTILINEASQLKVFFEKVRQRAHDELRALLLCPDYDQSRIELEFNNYRKNFAYRM